MLESVCEEKRELQYVSTCAITDVKTRPSLLEDYRKVKKIRTGADRTGAGMLGKVAKAHVSPRSSAFWASFAEGKVGIYAIAD